MGYIDENLMSGEQIIYRTKLHWIIFTGPIIVALFSLFCFFVGGDAISLGGILLLVAVILGISKFIALKTAEFGISNKRVLIKIGFIKRNSMEILLSKIEGIQVDQGIIGRILDYGSIIITGTGGTHNPFHSIQNPLNFRKIVQEQIGAIK
jgi:uncharacterized membrane protein YdbT with pleckstrin-like domain